MQTHPFIGSVINRVMGITLSVVAWMMCSWLLFCYGGEEIWIACLDGLVSVGLLAAAGFLYGYVDGYSCSANTGRIGGIGSGDQSGRGFRATGAFGTRKCR